MPNVIVVVIDSLRKDYAKPLEEFLAKSGFQIFDRVVSPAPWTLPSHASIFTGTYPIIHGSHESKKLKGLNIKFVSKNLLCDNLKSLGYDTYLFSANPWISSYFGLNGFDYEYIASFPPVPKVFQFNSDEYHDLIKIKEKLSSESKIKIAINLFKRGKYNTLVKAIMRSAFNNLGIRYIYLYFKGWPRNKGSDYLLESFKRILKTNNKNSFFAFFNLMEVHEPYSIGDKGSLLTNFLYEHIPSKIVSTWRVKYPKQVDYIILKIKKLIDILKENNLLDKSLIIVTSDHGQLLGEYEKIGHGIFLYDELLFVPFAIKYPSSITAEPFSNSFRYKYMSLTRIKKLIFDIIMNNYVSVDRYYTDYVYAESYGIHENLPDRKLKYNYNYDEYDVYRIAVYYKKYKAVYNVAKDFFEEIVSYDRHTINGDIKGELKDLILKFLKLGLSFRKLKSIYIR